MSALRAVLWDLDGTLIDSEPLWFDAMCGLAAAYGGTWNELDHLATVGSHLPDSAAILRQHGVDLPVDTIVELLLAEVGRHVMARPPFTAGSLDLARRCAVAGWRQALVTMTYASLAGQVADLFAQRVPGGFAAVITGDRVSRGKPFPDPYQEAAGALGLKPVDCVAIEDSPTGVRSAMAAGVPTVVVQGPATVPEHPGLSRVASLKDLDVDLLRLIHGGLRVDLVNPAED